MIWRIAIEEHSVSLLLWRYRVTALFRRGQSRPYVGVAAALALVAVCSLLLGLLLLPLYELSTRFYAEFHAQFGMRAFVAATHVLDCIVWLAIFVPSVLQIDDSARKSFLWQLIAQRCHTPETIASLIRSDATVILLGLELGMAPFLCLPVWRAVSVGEFLAYLATRIVFLLLLRTLLCTAALVKVWTGSMTTLLILQWAWLIAYLALILSAVGYCLAADPLVVTVSVLRFFIILQEPQARFLLPFLIIALWVFGHFWLLALAQPVQKRGTLS